MTDKTDRRQQLDAICEAALDRDGEDRAAFVREACGADDEMRRQVEAILANLPRADLFLAQPAAAIAAVLTRSSSATLTGLRLDGYEIGPLIGAGGMGHVYKAHDTGLGRDVAVKVLPPECAHDPDRLARFAREARVLAALNHQNIAQIHGLAADGATTAIVMELVEGETLADRVVRGPLTVREALPIARQIADALEAAHEQGVTHRDLKPANIQVRADGTVKVLDFGLAKMRDHATEPADAAGLLRSSSIPGVVLGTAAYMAPEQAQCQPVDRRADMWALGCVVFEMLTAQPAFAGETASFVLVKIVDEEPAWEALPDSTPAAIRRLLQRCLEKDPRRRLDSAAAARLEIDEAARDTAAVNAAARRRVARPLPWRSPAWVAATLLTAALAATVAVIWARRGDAGGPLVVTSMTVESLPLAQPGVHFSVAPHGRTVIFAAAAAAGDPRVIFRRDLNEIEPEPLVGTVGASDPFFSPDGRRLGFETRSELWTASLDGGTPQLLVPNLPLRGGAWGEHDQLVVGRAGSGLWLASAGGGASRQLTAPADGERHELPQILPGGRDVLFTALSVAQPPRVSICRLSTGEIRDLFEGTGAQFVESGHLVFGRQGKLWAVGFDPAALEPRGEARPVRDDVLWSSVGYPQFAIGGSLLAYARGNEASHTGITRLRVLNRRGEPEPLALPPDTYLLARFSPSGDRFVVSVGAARQLWTYDFGRGTLTRLLSDRVAAFSAPTWSSDGQRVVFMTWFNGRPGLGWLPADGSAPTEPLVNGVEMRSFERTNPTMLPDGSGVIVTGLAAGASVEDLLIMRFAKNARLETLLAGPGVERNPAVAPNGRFIAYNSDESGRPEVYVRPFPEVGVRRWQISSGGGAFPVWTKGGRELIYKDGQGRLVAVAVAEREGKAGELDFSSPVPLFALGESVGAGLDRDFDVTSDGERVLTVTLGASTAGEASVLLVLVHNWVEELKRLVPSGR